MKQDILTLHALKLLFSNGAIHKCPHESTQSL